MATTSFGDAPKGLFSSPPRCMMHRQASFITGFFPDKGAEVARGEADAFYFPPFASENLGNPVLGAGTLYTMAKDSPATRGFFKYLQEASAHEAWMQQGVFLTAHKALTYPHMQHRFLESREKFWQMQQLFALMRLT